MSRTLLALHAHPDDESSKGAATVARYADAGVRCVLVTATGGEAGDVLNPAMDTPDVRANLSGYRRQELDEAARIIGFDEVAWLGYRDSGMPATEHNDHPDAFVNVPFEEALRVVVEIVRRVRPHVVLGYDEHVRYPHPDHLRIHDLSLAAFEAAGDATRFPGAGAPWSVAKLYAPVFTRAKLEALHAGLVQRGLPSPLEERLEQWREYQDPDRIARIDVCDTLPRSRAALRAHRTQIDPESSWFFIPEEVVCAEYPYEDFELMNSRVPVEPPEDDLFAGIDIAEADIAG